MKHFSALALVIGLLALLPAAASAQDASEGYGAVAGVSTGAGSGSGGDSDVAGNVAVSDNAAAGAGDLPFTGLDLGLVAGAGGLLLIGGLAMRRLNAQ
ncbi:MAG: hypothetical protein AVDCRST_MAG13-1498 [uncultured Solirubrobacteraceae bacterium]|uniref:Gram-positive cocci surface proteins LPxTG domain-containing protein n=1 Tax=uncultured Solirubrobacteraceae bacterium TaxID=1162706 RepID=A0A6J4S0K9_9ACTN|nr:MAG: hypothetical protein AVDCRST_MAG13-1498 [uncultured Solirubrobacteraceae bacterium]